MKCCANCFGDRGLRKEIIPLLSNSTGTCSFCNSDDISLVAPKALVNYFELLINIYTPTDDGFSLVELLKKDWLLFEDGKLDLANAQLLLGEILDDGEIIRKKFSTQQTSDPSRLDSWEQFRKELMYENRFFPSNKIDERRLEILLSHLLLDQDEMDNFNIWYRARIQNSKDEIFSTDEMGAPPNHLTSQGRANPAGIPYLYLASDRDTCVAEVRPHTGEYATVAEIAVTSNLKIVDLRSPRSTVSPFLLEDETEIALLREDIEFLVELGKELTRPVLPHVAAIEYIPSQFICEFIKKCGYHGVFYGSSVGDGVNFSLFNPDNAEIKTTNSFHVARVTVQLS